jgi:nucleotide-binding universal stress UspA family protein
MKILLAVDGSKHSLGAAACLVRQADLYREKPQVELVTVHRPVPSLHGMGAAVSKSQIDKYYQEEGEQALAGAKKELERAGLGYEARILVGDPAEQIVSHAKKAGCALIYIGTPKALIGSTATKVMNLSDVPVVLVR